MQAALFNLAWKCDDGTTIQDTDAGQVKAGDPSDMHRNATAVASASLTSDVPPPPNAP